MGTPDPTAPDPGPEPKDLGLQGDELIKRFLWDLTDDQAWAIIRARLIRDYKLSEAGSRQMEFNRANFAAWERGYVRRYGTDEG